MKKNPYVFIFNVILVVLLAGSLIVSTANAGKNESSLLASVPTDMGYIDFTYGEGIKAEPTAETAESKLWWNDGRWWGVLFDPTTQTNTIYWFDWGNKTWVKTATSLDSRKDATDKVAVRFDALWDEDNDKLYLASHIKFDNPSKVNNDVALLNRYSYQQSTKTYQLDPGFPVSINEDKTESLVIDKDDTGRLWATYVSREALSDIYHVYVNYTDGTDTNWNWNDAFNLATLDATAATVDKLDISSVIAFGDNVGIMWSNILTDQFYFAVHPSSSSDPEANWDIDPITVPGVTLTANDHIKLVKNNSGQVFAAIKTDNTLETQPLIGLLARATNGVFTFAQISNGLSVDTRPSLVWHEDENRLYLFVSSNETGGVICVNTIQLPSLSVDGGNCSSGLPSPADHFIASSTYNRIDNATTTKQAITNDTGLVVLASDDENGSAYLHNTMGNPLPAITRYNPASGATLNAPELRVSVTFSHPMDETTLTSSSFTVTRSGSPVPGQIQYNEFTRTATFIGDDDPVDGATYVVTLNDTVEDESGRSLYNGGETWQFLMNVVGYTTYLPIITR